MNSLAISCIVDQPRYLMAQSFIWVSCLLDIQKVPLKSIFVHVAGIADPKFLPWLKSLGVNVVTVEPFDPRSPHCNKLRQLDTFAGASFDQVVLMDCDTAWVGDAPLPRGEPVAGKIVDNSRPPENLLAGIFQAAGLGEPNWVEVSIPKDDGHPNSDWNNFNGGLYILDGRFVAKLSPAWHAWAAWCLDRPNLFGEFARHIDQVSFALALRELGVWGGQLPIEWNYPTYSHLLPDVTPQILHYGQQFDPPFKLRKTGILGPDRAIDALNRRIEAFLATHSTRWVTEPVMASWKRQVLNYFRGGSLTSIQ